MLEDAIRILTGRRSSAASEDGAFAHLYEAYAHAVYNYCLFRVGVRPVAEDLTGDVFEKAWRARHRYRADQATFTTWLFTLARNTVTDWQRRQQRYPLVALSDGHPAPGPLPEAQVERGERDAHLHALIHALSEYEQELVALKFGAGMTNRQMAELLERSETAIGSAIYRLMRKLRAQWEEADV